MGKRRRQKEPSPTTFVRLWFTHEQFAALTAEQTADLTWVALGLDGIWPLRDVTRNAVQVRIPPKLVPEWALPFVETA